MLVCKNFVVKSTTGNYYTPSKMGIQKSESVSVALLHSPVTGTLLYLTSTLCGMATLGVKMTSYWPEPMSRIECLTSWPAARTDTDRVPRPACDASTETDRKQDP